MIRAARWVILAVESVLFGVIIGHTLAHSGSRDAWLVGIGLVFVALGGYLTAVLDYLVDGTTAEAKRRRYPPP